MRQSLEFILALGNINPLTLSLSLPSTCKPQRLSRDGRCQHSRMDLRLVIWWVGSGELAI